ncbi:ABC transporter ATP-binding protein [Streptomyces sp. GC420]|uniref:ATP-binding cassette domain-containing protein n=1 Tax=Streptomyces sp. GC420 TaxID=2697568 RepID=UPI001414FCF2|nr:ABC transporter ATP-binding protein [Streptomyces sp. GC420]NBM14154.1 ATP-binding cassette domain-containing protein [Streptomyces sp. GC420]
MIQAVGLTSTPRKDLPPAVDDLTFAARPGQVTVLLGPPGAGKSTALRLMLELEPGRGLTLFRGRPPHTMPHPAREIGAVLGEVQGRPARSLLGHLRMMCAAAGVAASRAGEVLDLVGLTEAGHQRLDSLSRGMDRRLALAAAIVGDPHTLLLDEPADGLPARESTWLHRMLRAHAAAGGTVLVTTRDAKEAARLADRVVAIDGGRLVADQAVTDFARIRLRPRVAVRTPHAVRLAALLAKEARAAHRSVEVVTEGGGRLSVFGSDCADVGETAFRHGILLHRLVEETGDTGVRACAPPPGDGSAVPEGPLPQSPSLSPAPAAAARPRQAPPGPAPNAERAPSTPVGTGDKRPAAGAAAAQDSGSPAAPGVRQTSSHPPEAPAGISVPPLIRVRPPRAPLHPLRYELRRATSARTLPVAACLAIALSVLLAVFAARTGHTPLPRLLAAWPDELPLPPAALCAGLLGALAFGEEFRHPVLADRRAHVPRRLGLLLAKLAVSAGVALLLAALTVAADGLAIHLVYGLDPIGLPADRPVLAASWGALLVGSSWSGLLAAGMCRSTLAGVAAVLAVPVAVMPALREFASAPVAPSLDGLPERLRAVPVAQWPEGADRWLLAALRVVAQPVGGAMALSLAALLCGYLFTALRSRAR